MMNTGFRERIREDIQKSESAWARLFLVAERARQRGDEEQYWALTSPINLAALYHIAGDAERIQALYRSFAIYYASYRAWAVTHHRDIPPSYAEASAYFMAGMDAQARACFLTLSTRVKPEQATMLGIPLICVGAVSEGRELLRKRQSWLRASGAQGAAMLHQQGEIAFWLGDLALARACADLAVATWPAARPLPPVVGLQALYAALAASGDQPLAAAARAALEISVRWFYANDLLSQAVDAREYLKVLAGAQPGQHPRVRGMTMPWRGLALHRIAGTTLEFLNG